MFPAVALAIAVVSIAPQVPVDVVREQAERELALVRHIHRHVRHPSDGLALAADRRALQRRGPGAPAGAPLSAGTSDVDLLGQLTILTDLWYARVIDRTPFQRMPRERLARMDAARTAISELQSRTDPKARDTFLADAEAELQTLVGLTGGHADITEADVDLALALVDSVERGQLPTTGPHSSGTPTAALATASPAGCQLLRESAGASSSSAGMLRVLECWTALQAWPGWVAQVVESLDWAETYAKVDRDCPALGEVLDRAKSFGRPLTADVKTEDVASIAERAEADRRQLKAAKKCR
jgi:hypothetical protein